MRDERARKAPGGIPAARVKCRVKALWSQKPQVRAMEARESSVPARRCMA